MKPRSGRSTRAFSAGWFAVNAELGFVAITPRTQELPSFLGRIVLTCQLEFCCLCIEEVKFGLCSCNPLTNWPDLRLSHAKYWTRHCPKRPIRTAKFRGGL